MVHIQTMLSLKPYLLLLRVLREKKMRFDHYVVPNSLVELSLLYIDQGRRDEAIKLLTKAK